MDITITVSEKAEQKIRRQAAKNGKNVKDFVGKFVEEVLEEKFPETIEDRADANGNVEGKRERKHNLLKFAGMFSSGKTDTSERMHEILYSEDFDPAEGFSVK
ncbi:MAG: hypothetical protein M3Q99_05380 [Acidobacteriota bacterium]|nr:hypothetical protein [Acidobacteriota bacterium]